ncbi:MAG: TOBE domain-containing protein, partial [Beijerinckiaceae bacterium]
YVTHDQEEALAVSDRVIVMANAVIAQSGTPRELYEAPASLFVADFIGDSNIVDAEVGGVSGSQADVRLATLPLKLPHRDVKTGAAKIAIRPDSIHLATEKIPDAVEGSIAHAAYLGKHMEYTVQSPAGELFVIDKRVHQPIPVGTAVSVTFDTRGMTLIPI